MVEEFYDVVLHMNGQCYIFRDIEVYVERSIKGESQRTPKIGDFISHKKLEFPLGKVESIDDSRKRKLLRVVKNKPSSELEKLIEETADNKFQD